MDTPRAYVARKKSGKGMGYYVVVSHGRVKSWQCLACGWRSWSKIAHVSDAVETFASRLLNEQSGSLLDLSGSEKRLKRLES